MLHNLTKICIRKQLTPWHNCQLKLVYYLAPYLNSLVISQHFLLMNFLPQEAKPFLYLGALYSLLFLKCHLFNFYTPPSLLLTWLQ